MDKTDLQETAALMNAARTYFEGMAEGNEAKLRAVFDPDAQFQGVRDGAHVRRGLDAFVTMTEEAASSDPMPWSLEELQVSLVDRTGDVALLKVVDLYRGRLYTDYLTLIRTEGTWRIVNKAFWCHPQSAAADA